MLQARGQQRGGGSTSGEISQLLLIVSDGRGLFLEGMEAVKSSIRQAMEANVFVVFVVIDNPNNKVCGGHFVCKRCKKRNVFYSAVSSPSEHSSHAAIMREDYSLRFSHCL